MHGQLHEDAPGCAGPEGGNYVTVDSVDFILLTHLTSLATSGFISANFAGAVGS